LAGVLLSLWTQSAAQAGGGPENVLLFIDPSSPDSLYVGHYYKHARNIPDRNVVYFDPVADNFNQHRQRQSNVLFGALEGRNLLDHIDYVVIPPGSTFFMAAPGLVTDSCAAVTRFSASSGYTMAYISDVIAGGVSVDMRNHYYSTSNFARAFDARTHWSFGNPTTVVSQPRYFIGAMLGYSGERGNTVEETITMIDRAVASDGTRPAGVTYYMRTTDVIRSGPRDPFYQAAIAAIVELGGQALLLDAVLPTGRHDILGIMTGAAELLIDETNMTILPGAFCDHLTSYAARFDTPSQRKVSRWIARGAAGSWGAVQEPCNYAGKFPHARMHVYYHQGASLGEAALRSVQYVPFQMLLYGDPLTRPFAHLPSVRVSDAPTSPVHGVFVLTPAAETSHPAAEIAGFDLYVDGELVDQAGVGRSFTVDSTDWADGYHDVRVVAYDNSLVKSQGRWVGSGFTGNAGRSVDLDIQVESAAPGPAIGDMSARFMVNVAAKGGEVAEIRVLSADRVILATSSPMEEWTVIGQDLGAGPMTFQAVAEYKDGARAVSEPVEVNVTFEVFPPGEAGDAAPVAYSYTKDIPINVPTVLELPATDADGSLLAYSIVKEPTQSTIDGIGPTILLRPDSGARGTDTLSYVVNDGSADSNLATVTIRYALVLGDLTGDRDVDLEDFRLFALCFSGESGAPPANCPDEAGAGADLDRDGDVDLGDHAIFVASMTGPQ
jgi:hypothetical protein